MEPVQKFNNVMIDLETLGTQTNSAILSIAAVSFDIKTGEVKHVFNIPITLQSCLDLGMKVDEGAFMFWLKQSKEARSSIYDAKGKVHLIEALAQLTNFIKKIEEEEGKSVMVWGNGAIFDIGILNFAYNLNKLASPWRYTNEMCLRTIAALYPDTRRNEPFLGVPHDPIDDCLHQIKYLVKIMNKIYTKDEIEN